MSCCILCPIFEYYYDTLFYKFKIFKKKIVHVFNFFWAKYVNICTHTLYIIQIKNLKEKIVHIKKNLLNM